MHSSRIVANSTDLDLKDALYRCRVSRVLCCLMNIVSVVRQRRQGPEEKCAGEDA